MKTYEEEAIKTALYWNQEGFNKRNKKISVDYLNFPHIRFANNNITIHKSPEEFLKNWDRGQENLDKQGWDHTDTLSIKPVQSDKNNYLPDNILAIADKTTIILLILHSFSTIFATL